ncbi:synaptic plasticity regulator PANTS-like [Ornithodoros turicata]|uniref:synaptic plasticity regulator PANTS-like n=1 Tax=Ornithodoros turicata TaxID=34597 RepID=UPI003139BA12
MAASRQPLDSLDAEVFEKADSTELPRDSWMVRPCEWYVEEYADCKSIKARFHQYFIFGHTIDCSQWKTDYDNCMLWRKSSDIEALKSVIDSEHKRKEDRLKATLENNVWELRTEPPKDWNKALPEWMVNKFKNTYLAMKQKEMETEYEAPQKMCVIS